MKWIEVVNNPYALVAFALALVFGVAGVKLADRKKPWFLPVAIILVAIVIVGGLYLAYINVQSKASSAITTPQGKPGKVNKQVTKGPNSPAVQDVHGNVTIIQNKSGTGK